jgi:hypothetical protein
MRSGWLFSRRINLIHAPFPGNAYDSKESGQINGRVYGRFIER